MQCAIIVLDVKLVPFGDCGNGIVEQTFIWGQDAFSEILRKYFSTIRDSDLIILLENGEIAEQGTHGELMALGGRYARMYRTQTGNESRV